MSRISDHHKPGCGSVGKCSVPMFNGGSPDGFCDNPAYGEQYQGYFQQTFSGNRISPYASAFCCKMHGGPGETDTRFVRDGNMWCAFRPDFENLQESIAGFGATQVAAYDDMAARISAAITKAKGGAA